MLTLVTGGAGFLGSHLVDALVAAGDRVIVIDNLSTGRLRNLEAAISTGRTTFVYGDVATPAEATRALLVESGAEKIDRIFHLASPASPTAYGEHRLATLAVNGIGTMALVEIALEHDATFVFASTSEIYGDPELHPQPESYFGNVDPIGPRSCYDEGKRFGEATVAAAISERGLDGRIARFFNCYGPRMDDQDGRLIPAMLEAVSNGTPFPIHGTGRQTRSMTFVEDAVAGLLHLAASQQFVLRPMNIGNDDERSVEEIARAVAAVAGVSFVADYLDPRPQDPQRRRPDLSFARSLGWSPETDLSTGLRATLEWYHQARHAFA